MTFEVALIGLIEALTFVVKIFGYLLIAGVGVMALVVLIIFLVNMYDWFMNKLNRR